jgi:hypothetical protein
MLNGVKYLLADRSFVPTHDMFGYMGHAELVEALRGGPLRTPFDKLRMTQQMSFPFQNPMDLITEHDKY